MLNIAEGRPARQSSTLGNAIASYAVDGNVYGACSVTSESSSPWWRVDLGNTYRVDDVVVVIGGISNGGLLNIYLFNAAYPP